MVGSFGRGAYILDDYTALRDLSPQAMTQDAALFQLRDAYLFEELGQVRAAWGDPSTPNPPFGAIFTYHVAKPPAGDARLVLTIADETGKQVRQLQLSREPGMHRIAWNLRGEAQPGQGGGRGGGGGEVDPELAALLAAQGGGRGGPQGPVVAAGRYRATLATAAGDKVTPLGEPQLFSVVPLPR